MVATAPKPAAASKLPVLPKPKAAPKNPVEANTKPPAAALKPTADPKPRKKRCMDAADFMNKHGTVATWKSRHTCLPGNKVPVTKSLY
jgi:hypothetical protein